MLVKDEEESLEVGRDPGSGSRPAAAIDYYSLD